MNSQPQTFVGAGLGAEYFNKVGGHEGPQVLDRPEQPFGVYSNFSEFKSDHVVVFLFKRWQPIKNAARSPEIEEWNFFSIDALPEGTTAATQRRLDEIAGKLSKGYLW